MRHQWNTGRYYSPEGQRIIAETVEGGIVFADIDRGITGFMPCHVSNSVESSRLNFKYFVMELYDHCAYTDDPTGRDKLLIWED